MRSRWSEAALVLAIAVLGVLCGTCGSAESPPAPTLAIINKHRDPAVADLLFSKLAAGGEFALVERDQLARVLGEQELSSSARESSVRTGKLIGADALLFVEADRSLLHLRLVETQRGERVSEAVFALEHPDFPAIVEATKARLAALARKLRTPPPERLYVALGPITTFDAKRGSAETLATLSTLLGVRLVQNERVIVVERERLAEVVAEKDLGAAPVGELSRADALVRGRLLAADAAQLRLEFQVQFARGSPGATFDATIDRTNLGEGAAAVAVKIAGLLGLKDGAPDTSLAAEARGHYVSGLALLHAQLFEPALRSLETACLLDPKEEKRARTFAGGAGRCIGERIGRSVQGGSSIPAAEYLFYIDRLRTAMELARRHGIATATPLAENGNAFRFLAVQNDSLTAEDREHVAACRRELRGFFEWFCGGSESENHKRLLGDYAPLFFEEPRAALEYLRRILAAGGYPWSRLREHFFPRIDYWDKAVAGNLWSEFLEEIARDPSSEKQWAAVAERCFFSEAFPSAYSQGVRGKGQEAAQRLFAWLAARPENLDWVLSHEKWYIFLRLWHAMHSLPLEEQDRYFQSVMLKVLAKARGSEHDAFHYLSSRYHHSITNRHAPQDAPQIRKLLDAALATLAVSNPKLHREQREKLRADKSLSKLLGDAPNSEILMPEVPGGIRLFDSAKPGVGWFDAFNGLADGEVLWLAHTKPQALIVTRVEMRGRTSATIEFPVEASGQSAFEQLVLARSARFLFIADKYRVLAIPVAAKEPFLSASSYEIIGPKFGADETAGSHAREVTAGRDSRFRRITAVIPGEDAVYNALDQRTHDFSNRYGAIYRWRPGANECEFLCASDSLKPGPLNDCLPYSVAGGCASPDGKAMYFSLGDVPRQPSAWADGQRRGAWRFMPASNEWERIRERRFEASPLRPRFVSKTVFAIPVSGGGNDRLNVETGEFQHAPGAVSGTDARRGWEAKLEVESEVRFRRLYRVDAQGRTRLLSLTGREFDIGALIPTEQGLAVLLMGLQPGGNVPTTRGLVYLLPEEK